jgi:hypothetical protein
MTRQILTTELTKAGYTSIELPDIAYVEESTLRWECVATSIINETTYQDAGTLSCARNDDGSATCIWLDLRRAARPPCRPHGQAREKRDQ